jgi:hypothetical protein
MIRKRMLWIAGCLALALLLLGAGSVIAGIQTPERLVETQVSGTGGPVSERQREVVSDAAPDAAQNAPEISFIDSPSATCYQLVQNTNACTINWNYLNVSAGTSSYMISMTVSIDNQMRAYYSGFFQNSMYIPYGMNAPGFKVSCGLPGAGGKPDLGNAYAYTIRARATDGLSSANYGTVYCPSYISHIYLPYARLR